jgi:hypothetical protein
MANPEQFNSAPELVLYDLASKDGIDTVPWSPSTWRVHVLLRLAQIPYNTEFLEFDEIEPLFKGLGVPPNTDPKAHGQWTVPVLRLPTPHHPTSAADQGEGKLVMDSLAIAKRLAARGLLRLQLYDDLSVKEGGFHEFKQFTRTLRHSPAVLDRVEALKEQLIGPVAPLMLPAIVNLLSERSNKWYRQKHEPNLPPRHKTFEEWRDAQDAKKCWAAIAGKVQELEDVISRSEQAAVVGKNDLGLSWEAIAVVALLAFLNRLGHGLFEGLLSVSGGVESRSSHHLRGLWEKAIKLGVFDQEHRFKQ